ncbi:MAG: 2-oxo acid dehydrogenase subunit E2 [Gemmatimonadetes bacterium]|nr:2-oxo acid dehydrogenase subunit E2 [Gemmatimonadota bacterium]
MSEPGTLIPFAGLRGKIAQRMLHSTITKPHVTLHTEVDATALRTSRDHWTAQVQRENGGRLTLTALLVKLVAAALRRHPRVNGRVEAEGVRLYPMVNVGVAVALDEGLVVPVVRNADRKDIPTIAVELAALVAKARAGQLKPPDLLDATFTISNLGSFGVTHFTPIINPPEIAILGVGRITAVPRCGENGWVEAPILNLDLSFDHGAVDGAQAARFLQVLTAILSDPEAALAAAGTFQEGPLSQPPT